MHSVCIICGLTSTDDSEEDLKESRVRKPGLRDCGAALLPSAGGLLLPPSLGTEANLWLHSARSAPPTNQGSRQRTPTVP